MNLIKMESPSSSRKNLRNFGLTMGVVICVLTALLALKHRQLQLELAFFSALFFLAAFFTPAILKPVYIFWMRLAFVLSWINTRLILIIIFYLVISPLGLLMRLLRKDLLERKIDKRAASYWKNKERCLFDRLDYERQF